MRQTRDSRCSLAALDAGRWVGPDFKWRTELTEVTLVDTQALRRISTLQEVHLTIRRFMQCSTLTSELFGQMRACGSD